MRAEQILTVYRKEMLETLRDRRTLIIMVGLPIILYPLLALVGFQAMSLLQSKIKKKELAVGVTGSELPLTRRILEAESEDETALLNFSNITADEAKEKVRSGELAAALIVPPEAADILENESEVELQIFYDGGSVDSQEAQRRVASILRDLKEELVTERLRRHDLGPEVVHPYRAQQENLASAERRGGFLLGGFLSFLLITMALTGAFYPAVDLSAGEKERGTLETLLVAPVGRGEIILGKYLTVLTISVATSLLNLACMGLTFSRIFSGIAESSEIAFSVNSSALLSILITLLPLAALFSAVTLGLATFARSFKEAQSYLTPVFVVVMLPSMLPVLPGIELTPLLASLPITGPALLFRALLLEEASWVDVATVFASTLLYAGLMLAWASDLYRKEETLFRADDGGTLRLRRPLHGESTPSAVAAATLFVVSLAGMGYFSLNASADQGIVATLLAPQILLYLLVPLGLAWWQRYDLARTFSLTWPRWRSALAVPVILAGAFPLVAFLAHGQQSYFPVPEEYQETLQEYINGVIEGYGAYGAILLVALVPAVCEETFCRGFLLAGFRRFGRPSLAVIGSGILFGILHLDPSRLLTTSCLGILLAVIVVRTGSIFPAMLLHFLNNAMAVAADPHYREIHADAVPSRALAPLFDGLERWQERLEEPAVLVAVLATSAVVLTLGLWLLPRSRPQQGEAQPLSRGPEESGNAPVEA